MDALAAPGVAADTEALLRLRHLVRRERARAPRLTAMPGGFVSRRRGRGLEIDETRVYAEGDDIRHIDRHATARSGVPHVRTFRDERDRTVLLVADFRPSMLWGTRRALRSVAAAEVLSIAGWRAVDGGARVGLLAFGAGEPVHVAPRGRDRGMVAVVGGLAAAHRAALAAVQDRAAEPTLEAALELVAGIVPRGASVMLATALDRPGPDFDAMAQAMAMRTALTVLLIADAFEMRPPPGAYPFATEDRRSAWARIAGTGAAVGERARRLERLGAAVAPIDAEAGPDAMALALEEADGRHR